MARVAVRGRARGGRGRVNRRRQSGRESQSWGLGANVVPRILVGAVDGIGLVVVGALDLVRSVLVSAVSGAANIGVEAVGATVAGTRGVVCIFIHSKRPGGLHTRRRSGGRRRY